MEHPSPYGKQSRLLKNPQKDNGIEEDSELMEKHTH
jgi:hypothetical protein